jgi:hypothetical protein
MVLSDEQKQLIRKYQQDLVGTPGRATYEGMLQENSDQVLVLKALDINTRKTYGPLFDREKQPVIDTETGQQKEGVVSAVYDDVELSQIAPYVSQRTTVPQCFFIVRFRSIVEDDKDRKGHVIVIEVNGVAGAQQTFRLMDPNKGCYLVNGFLGFNNWLLSNYFANSGYRQLYRKRIKIHQVEFPKPSPLDMAAQSFWSILSTASSFFSSSH